MSEPFAPLLPALATFAASIYAKANFEKRGDEAGEHPLGTGAFALDHWDKGSQVVLTRNPHYWQEGKPSRRRQLPVVGDDNARVVSAGLGRGRPISVLPPNQIEQVASVGRGPTVPGTAVGFITINEKVKPLDEAAVRCALAYAIDREAIAKWSTLVGPRRPSRFCRARPSSTIRRPTRSA